LGEEILFSKKVRVRREHFHRSREGGESISTEAEREEREFLNEVRRRRNNFHAVGENIFYGERGDHFHRS
jgi:hypothetical protein